MSKAEWIGLAGALVFVGPIAVFAFRKVFRDRQGFVGDAIDASQDSEKAFIRGGFKSYLVVIGATMKMLVGLLFPLLLFFGFWSFFSLWADDLLGP